MPAPYSSDLRQKAIDALERGERKSDVCRMLNIRDALVKIGVSRKKTYGYQERDEVERPAFQSRLENKLPSEMIDIDEAGIANRDDYPYGYSPIGERFYELKSGKRSERVSGMAALKDGNMLAPMPVTGSCHRDWFEMGLAQSLIPQLQPGEVMVIDNASFHHSQTIEQRIAEAQCEIWYLPTYSPDLNEIEHWWLPLKNWMRQRWDEFDSFRACVDATFKASPNVYT